MQTASPGKKDFESFRASGEASGVSLSVGTNVGAMRDTVARGLIALGVTPNVLTVLGFVFTLIGCCYLLRCAGHALPIDPFAPAGIPRSWWPVIVFAWFFLAAACDMLDGAVARLGHMHSDFGAVLDSTVDRFSDIAVYAACMLFFANRGNVTLCLLSFVAMSNTFLISYVKARAEDLIPDCSVGFWQRGERFFALLLGCLVGHLPTLIWVQAVLPFFTVLRRLNYTRAYLRAQSRGLPLPDKGMPSDWRRYVMLWRHPRGSIGFDAVAGANAVFIVLGAWLMPGLYGSADQLKGLL